MISVRILQLVIAGAAAQGVRVPDLLAASGLDPADLADPDARLPRAVEARLWHEAARLTGDDSFGLHLSELGEVDAFGALGFAVRSSASLGEAYARVIRYLRILAHGPVLDLQIDARVARLRHEPPGEDPPPARHAIEFLLAMLVVVARRSVDPAFTPISARFRHPAPARVDEHRRLFGPGVRFGQPHDEIAIERAILDRSQAQAEPALSAVLDQHLSALLAALPIEKTFLDRVRGALAAELARGDATLDATAARLRMSRRSLQRRLAQEGASLSSLLDRLRADLAVRHLSDSRESIGEVAFRLGFSDVSTFHRAFKRWTGETPAAYRRDRRGTSAAHGLKSAS